MGMFLWAVDDGVTRRTCTDGRLMTTACVAVGRRVRGSIGGVGVCAAAALGTVGRGALGVTCGRGAEDRGPTAGRTTTAAAGAGAEGWDCAGAAAAGAGASRGGSATGAGCAGCGSAASDQATAGSAGGGKASACCSGSAETAAGAAAPVFRRTTKPLAGTAATGALGLRLSRIFCTAAVAWSSSKELEWLFTS